MLVTPQLWQPLVTDCKSRSKQARTLSLLPLPSYDKSVGRLRSLEDGRRCHHPAVIGRCLHDLETLGETEGERACVEPFEPLAPESTSPPRGV